MRHLTWGLCLLLSTISTFAQHNYKPATVVLLNQQQLTGLVDYKEWDGNPRSFSFKDGNGQQTLGIRQVASLQIENLESFERFILITKVTGKPKTENGIQIGEKKVLTDTIFIRLITSGRFLNLYSYEDRYCTRFFVKNNSRNETRELIFDAFYEDADASQIRYSDRYLGQLSLYAHDTMAHHQDKVIGLLKHTTYTSASLTKIINLLNAEEVSKTNIRMVIKPFVGVFLQRSDARYSGNTPFADAAQTPSYRPGINAGLDFYDNNAIRKYVVRMEISASAASFETRNTEEANANLSYSYGHKFKQYKIGLAPQFLMNVYNKPWFKFNVGAGFGFDYSIFPNDAYYTVTTFFGKSNQVNNTFAYQHITLSVPVRAGVIINKKIDIFGKYNIPLTQQSNYLDFALKVRSVQLGINYLF